jgi:glyoxylase-like metal-dependent hydrolase (beta-lactamase superfamily II)
MESAMTGWKDNGNGIITFDAAYERPMLASIHMLIESGRVAFIDTGVNASMPNVLAALKKAGLDEHAVDYVLLTHIHLDHAGGAGSMMRAFPNAQLVVHPRGARHMAAPAKLVAGVTEVYGAEYVAKAYGEILPISEDRIVSAVDGYQISLAGRTLTFIDTPGHARHHNCIIDERTGNIFTGDMFGLSYRELDVQGRQFIFPTTTPSQFDPEAMRISINRLLQLHPGAMYLTHYGELRDIQQRGADLLRRLDAVVEFSLRENTQEGDRHHRLKSAMRQYLLGEIREHGCNLSDDALDDIWKGDLELNAQGLAIWLDSLNRSN